MASITLRSSLSRGLTNSEVDSNFTNLNNDKAENGANADITSMSGVTGEIGDPTQIQFDPQSSHPAYSEGLLWYDSIHNTLNYYGDESGLVHEIGLEEHQKVYNNSGVTIAKGEPLYFSGNFNGYPTAARANATDVNKYNAQGIAAHSIEDGTYGYVCTAGLVEGVDTSGLTAGANFFVGLTDGAVQNSSPTYPNFPMCLGWVVASNATTGVLLVNQQNHSVNSFRVRTDTHIGGDLIIDGDLTVVGSQTVASSTNVETGAPFLYLNSGDTIGEANTTFTGSGLDDAYFTGHFSGTASTTYYVKIDGVASNQDTFAWSKDNFTTTEASGINITGSDQALDDGISIRFASVKQHTLNDVWSGTGAPVDTDTGVWSNRNTGGTGVGYTHVGMFFDTTDSKFKFVDEYDPEPTGAINTADSSYSAGSLVVDGLEASSATVGGNTVLTTADEGSGNGIDADTVDGLEASQFVRSDADDNISGTLTLNATTPLRLSNSAQGFTYSALENGSGQNRFFIRVDRTNNGSYPYLTNRTPSGDVAIFTGGSTAGTENEIIRFKGGNGTRAIELTNSYIDMGTNDITDTKVGQWDTAYGWGDHSTQGYLTSYTDTNTTYSISAETVTNGANLRLTDSGSTTDEVSIIGGTNVTVARTNADTITISATDTDTTYSNATQSSNGLMSRSDKIKLDGIESGATGDQTASEILTEIKTVDGAGSGLDADVLDGQHGSYYQNASNLNAGTLASARLSSALATYSIDPVIPNGDRNSLSSPTLSMAALVDPAVENKMQFAVPDVIEGSTDGGTTWTDITSNYSTNDLKDMMSGTGTSGGINITSQQYDKIRIYWNYSQYNYGYVYLNYLHIYQSGRSNTATIQIEKKDFQTQVWSTVDTTGSHGGWPTHVWIPHTAIPYTSSNTRNDSVRITYDFTWSTSNSQTFSIHKINWYGTYPVAQHNRVSTWDRDGNFQVQNNLLVPNGTVDGRDIAADGTKLDGIEANATADQTASEIKTAYESNSNTNAFTDALLTKLNNIETAATADQTKADIDALGINADQLDGIEATSFLRSDVTDTANNNLIFGNVVTFNGSQTGGYPVIRVTSGPSSYGRIEFGTVSDVDEGIIAYYPSSNHFNFTVGTVERFRMEGDGDFHADGDVIAYSTTISDRRLKTDIKNIDDAVEKVKQLNGCTFKRHDGQVSAGVIAQDVEAVLPEAIREKELPLHLANDTTTYKLVEYDAIIGLLVESVKELTARVEELENAASDIRRD